MTERNKLIAGWLAAVFLLFHATFIFIYASPAQLISSKAKSFVNPYVSPLFEQSWSMFAPCPLLDGGIEFRIITENDTSNWLRPAEDPIYWHRLIRLTHFGELAILESNLIWWISYDMYDLNLELNEPIPNDKIQFYKEGKSYNLIKRYIFGTARNMNLKPIAAEAKCFIENVKSKESGELMLPLFKWK